MIELVVGGALSLLVIGALALLLSSVLRSQPENEDRAAQIQEARVVLERTVRELRQGKPVAGFQATSSQITIDAYTRSSCPGGLPSPGNEALLCRVTYACAQAGRSASCTRRAGSGTATTVLTGLASPNVFSYSSTTTPTCNLSTIPTPGLVCLTLTYPDGDGGETVTIEDSAYLRNRAS